MIAGAPSQAIGGPDAASEDPVTRMNWERPKRPPNPGPPAGTGNLVARYPGCCRACSDAIAPGERIAYDLGKIVHAGCFVQGATPLAR